MKKSLLFILAAVVLMCATGCIDDSFSESPNDLLAFSADTVAFDTVLTLQGTATKQFIVYNRGSKQVRISSIKVAGVSSGKFYLNVDGVKGKEFKDIELRGNDSLFVFVEGYFDEAGKNEPQEISDRIEFVTNGVTQHVTLYAWGQDAVRLRGDTLWTDYHMTADKPYVIYDTLVVAPKANLTVDPGATLLFHSGGALKVYGTMTAIGTQEKHITLRGDRLDHVVGEIGFDIMSGQWGGVVFGVGSYANHWEFVDMRGSEFGVQISSDNPDRQTLYMLNCMLHNSAGSLLTEWNAGVTAYGTEFSDCADGVINLMGGKTNFAQCTFTNYYLFKNVTEPLLNVYNIDGDYLPIRSNINNCILYGMCSDINAGDLTGTDIYLRNCLIKADGTDDDNFINIVWAGDAKFYTVRDDKLFDYRLQPESDAIARGDRSLCPAKARYDRYGVDRLATDSPDLGAYAAN